MQAGRLRRGVARSLIAAGAVILLAADLFVVTERTHTTTVGRSEALHRVRTHPRAPTVVAMPTPTDPTAGVAATAVPSTPAPKSVPTLSTRRAVSRSIPAPAPAPGDDQRFRVPPTGVYTYRTLGGEQISLAAAHHDYPPESYATVRPTSGCGWLFEHPIIKEHVDRTTMCSGSARLSQLRQGREVQFFGQTDGDTYNCDAPPALLYGSGDAVGHSHDGICRSPDGKTTAALSVSYLGNQRITVGVDVVDAVHFVVMLKVAGGRVDHGTGVYEYWVHPATGLFLHVIRDLDLTAHAAFGNVRYHEHAELTLKSLVPAT